MESLLTGIAPAWVFAFSDVFSCFLLISHALIYLSSLFFFLFFLSKETKDKKKSLLKTWKAICRRKGTEILSEVLGALHRRWSLLVLHFFVKPFLIFAPLAWVEMSYWMALMSLEVQLVQREGAGPWQAHLSHLKVSEEISRTPVTTYSFADLRRANSFVPFSCLSSHKW